METIHSLRKKGFKVRVLHSRFFKNASHFLMRVSKDESFYGVLAKGGKTHIDLTTPEGKTVSGESVCSVEDTFSRRLGNKIALGRALKQLE
jgi:hypothetical protein